MLPRVSSSFHTLSCELWYARASVLAKRCWLMEKRNGSCMLWCSQWWSEDVGICGGIVPAGAQCSWLALLATQVRLPQASAQAATSQELYTMPATSLGDTSDACCGQFERPLVLPPSGCCEAPSDSRPPSVNNTRLGIAWQVHASVDTACVGALGLHTASFPAQ